MRRQVLIGAALLMFGCGGNDVPEPDGAGEAAGKSTAVQGDSYEETLRLALENASPGTVIDIPAGTHRFTRSLTLNTHGVTLRGAGMEDTVLSFRDQVAGAEGLLVNASDFTIEDLAIEDTVGDALKINEAKNVIIRRVRTEWTNGPDPKNGAYGIYPVQTENTLVEGVVAIGASDAGIYVGQSKNVVVRDSRAEYNVAGIEIENTIHADVHGNVARHNTGGILVFNMPDLPVAGHSTRVFDNQVTANNTDNFGAPGSAVASVPAGSGIIINSNDRVEIFGNELADNRTAHVLISSLFSAQYTATGETAEGFDPYPEGIYIHDNNFGRGGWAPDREALEQLRHQLFGADGTLPDIVWDGITPPETGAQPVLCIRQPEASFVNLDAANDYASPSTDLVAHDCSTPELQPVRLHING